MKKITRNKNTKRKHNKINKKYTKKYKNKKIGGNFVTNIEKDQAANLVKKHGGELNTNTVETIKTKGDEPENLNEIVESTNHNTPEPETAAITSLRSLLNKMPNYPQNIANVKSGLLVILSIISNPIIKAELNKKKPNRPDTFIIKNQIAVLIKTDKNFSNQINKIDILCNIKNKITSIPLFGMLIDKSIKAAIPELSLICIIIKEIQESAKKGESIEPVNVSTEEFKATNEEPVQTTIEEPVQTTIEESIQTTTEEPIQATNEEPVQTINEEPLQATNEEPVQTTIEEPMPSNNVITNPVINSNEPVKKFSAEKNSPENNSEPNNESSKTNGSKTMCDHLESKIPFLHKMACRKTGGTKKLKKKTKTKTKTKKKK